MRLNMPREFYIPAGGVKVADKLSTAIAYAYTAKSGKFGAVAFRGKGAKPVWHYTFRDTSAREKCVRQHFENVRAWEGRRASDRAQRTAFAHSIKVGDIYRTCWGYDQTNVEFFEVTEIRGKYAILREIAAAVESRGQGCESVVAQSGAYLEPRYPGDDRGQPIRRLIQQHGIKIDDVRTASPWGQRGPGGIVIGPACHQTASGWGH